MENLIGREILEFYCCFQDTLNVSLILMSKQSLALNSFLFDKDTLQTREIIFLSPSHLKETKRVTFSTKGRQPIRPSNACVRTRKRRPFFQTVLSMPAHTAQQGRQGPQFNLPFFLCWGTLAQRTSGSAQPGSPYGECHSTAALARQ